jgi:uncharacterized membrane protein
MHEKSKKYVYILIFLHLAIVLPLAYVLNIWADEASTLYTTENGYLSAFQTALADEKQAPLYFWILSVWREIDDSIFFARLFSVICSISAIKVFYDLARKFFDSKAVLFITAFFAFHPYLIWASAEIRVYSLVILLTVLLLKFFYEGYFETEENFHAKAQSAQNKQQIYFILTAIVALYSNYYLGFLLAGCFFALIVCGKFQKAKTYFLQMILVGVVFLPLLWAIGQQFSANTSGFRAEKSLLEGMRILWNFFLTFLLPTEIFPEEESTLVSIFRVWLARFAILAAIVFFVKKRRNFHKETLVFGTIAATIFAFLLAAYFLLGPIYVGIRHAAVAFAPLILFAGLILREIFRSNEKKANNFNFLFFAAALFFASLFIYSIFALYPNLSKRGDWARIADFIERNEKPNQPIVIFTTFDALALPYHYRGVNKILPDEKFFEWEFEAEIGNPESLKRQTEFIISEIPADAKEIWLATNEKCEIKQTCQPLENFVRANYTIVETKDFYKEKLFLLRKNSNDR